MTRDVSAHLRDALIAALIVLVAAFIVFLGHVATILRDTAADVHATAAAVATLPDRAERQVEQTRKEMRADLEAAKRELLMRVDTLTAATTRIAEEQFAAARAEALAIADRRLDQAIRGGLSEVAQTRAGLTDVFNHVGTSTDALATSYARIPDVLGARLDPWTDCRGNGACWQAQFTAALGASRATLGETSRAMKTVREATPSILGNFDRTANNVERMTRPDSLGIRLFKAASPAFGGAILGAFK